MTVNNHSSYFTYSKNIISSLVFIFPFLLVYEIICFLYFKNSSFQIRNSADVLLKQFFDIFGTYSNQYYALTLFAIIVFIFFINKNTRFINIVDFKYLILMFIEGFLYGLLLMLLLNNITHFDNDIYIYQNNLLLNLYLSIGAGIWEEILFRLFLFTLILKILNFLLKIDFYSIFISVMISSLIFSSFHYIGANSDIFDIYSFSVRFLGGVFLSLLYFYRGFGITSMCHISYDFILISLPLIYIN